MRALLLALVLAFLPDASGGAPASVTAHTPVLVLPALPGKAPTPSTGQKAVARASGVATAAGHYGGSDW